MRKSMTGNENQLERVGFFKTSPVHQKSQNEKDSQTENLSHSLEAQKSTSKLKRIIGQIALAALTTLASEKSANSEDFSHRPWRVGGVLGLAKGFYSGDLYLGRGVGNLEKAHLELGVELGNEAEKLALLSNKQPIGHYWRTAPHLNLLAGIALPIHHFDFSVSGLIGLNHYQYPRIKNKKNTAFLPTWQLQLDLGRSIADNLSVSFSWVLAAPITKRIENYDQSKSFDQQDKTIHLGQTLQISSIYSF